MTGHGECAMPPKKPGIYLADYNDCLTFFRLFCNAFSSVGQFLSYAPFEKVPARFFPKIRAQVGGKLELELVNALFGVMDSLDTAKEFRVCRNALEMALLDVFGQLSGVPTAELILGSEWHIERPTYYTVAMNSDHAEMKASAHFGVQHTPYLKLKMDKNVSFWSTWLPELHTLCTELTKHKPKTATLAGQQLDFVWSVDANADWSPDVARQMLPLLLPYKHLISMVEQPFPAHLNEDETNEWKQIKSEFGAAGFVIYADESVSTSADVHTLKDICHGVNIKLDKTGGVREALRTWDEATKAGLGVWIGIMVSSRLSTSMASCILPISTLGGDLDGQLLVDIKSDRFTKGLHWDVNTGLCSPPEAPGLGLERKTL